MFHMEGWQTYNSYFTPLYTTRRWKAQYPELRNEELLKDLNMWLNKLPKANAGTFRVLEDSTEVGNENLLNDFLSEFIIREDVLV